MFKARVSLCESLADNYFGFYEIADLEAQRFLDVYDAVASVERWIEANRGFVTVGDTVYRTPSGEDGAPSWALVSDESVSLTGIIWIEEVKDVQG